MKPLYVKKNGVVYKISGTGIPSIYPAANVEYDNTVTSELQATDVQGAIDELSTRQGGVKNTAYGTCDTAGDVKDKVATLVNATNWSLEVGTIVGIRFTYTNTCSLSGISLNVNNTGAKNIRYSDGILTSGTDPKCPTAFGEAGQTIYYMYDGTYWVWVSHSKDNDTTYAFEGNTFRSEDGSNYYHGDGTNGNANNMTTNGHYYYKSNGPSTAIGAYGTDGAMFVQAYDSDNVAQIAQNYENGNIFVRSKVNGSWTEWKKTVANITGNNTVLSTDKTPFLTRQTLNPTGFSGYVREKLVGASYAWNQLLNESQFVDETVGLTTHTLSNHKLTLVGTTSAACNYYFAQGSVIPLIAGHKYAFVGIQKFTSTGTARIRVYGGPTIGVIKDITSGVLGEIFSVTTSANYSIFFNFGESATVDFAGYPQLTDLTLAFGSTIADYLYGLSNNGGITKLRDMGCPIDKYTPYGYGLYSVKTSGKKIVGKNKNDNSNNVTGGYYESNGTWQASNDYATSGLIPVLPNTTYVGSMFDKNGNNRDSVVYTLWSDSTTCQGGYTTSTITTLSDTKFVRIRSYQRSASYITAKNFVFQLEIGSTNTAFEEYSCTTYPLGNDELRGKFDLVNGEIVASGDVKESNGGITRNYLSDFDLGSLNWKTFGSSYPNIFYAEITDGILSSNSTGRDTGSCAKYVVVAKDITAIGDKECTFGSRNVFNNRGSIMLKDTAYSDAATLKTSLSGSYATCEKATPTTEQSTPFADPMSLVGATTEEYIDTRDIPCPVGAERQYMGQSEDVVEIPSSPQSDGKRILISEVSGGKEQVYWDTLTKLNYHDYTVKGDGTTTWGDLLNSLRPIYESLSEDEKTFSKLIFRPESISGNECLSYCGAYWYSRMGLNSVNNALWIDHASLGPNSGLTYYYQKQGDTFIDKTSQTTTYSLSLRVFVEVGNNS